MSRIIFSIGLVFKLIVLGHAELCFFNFWFGKGEETTFEKFFRYINEFVMYIGSYQKDLYVLKTMIVLSLIGTITIIILLNKVIKGRHRTQRNDWPAKDCANTNQGSLAAEVNISNTLRVESSPQTCVRGDNRTTMKRPNEFNERIDVETWLVQLEVYLEKCVDKKEWFDVTLSHINVNCLKDFNIAESRNNTNNYQLIKDFLVSKYSAKITAKNLQLADFVNRKQGPNESVKDYANALKHIAQDVLKSTPVISLDEHLKDSLVKGLQNAELKACAIKKRYAKLKPKKVQ